MNTKFLPWFRALILAPLVVFSAIRAQDKDATADDAYAFSTRVYRMPSEELMSGFVSKDKGKLSAPALPGPNAGNGEIEAFIKRSHDVVKEYFAQHGVTLPKGSLACYDPATGTLALRAMNVVHEIVAPLAGSLEGALPMNLSWSLDILETKSASARAAMKQATGIDDHAGAYDRLLPQSKIVVSMRGEMKSGQITKAAQSARTDDPVEYSLDDKNRVAPVLEENGTGTEVELDPTIGVDGKTVDLNIALTHRHASGKTRWEPLTTASPEKLEARWVDRPLAVVRTSLTLTSGSTKLLGAWALDGDTVPEHADAVRVAFLRAGIITIQPLDDGRVGRMLKSRGEAVEPTPKAVRPVADPNMPPGMSVRRFRVPPDFLSMGSGAAAGSASPADPFASSAVPNEPRFVRRVTVEEMLRQQGIPFPPGASANYLQATGELVVRNTPANLDLVEQFVQSILDLKPKVIACSLHIVQADAALIRKLDREAFSQPDHSAAWQQIEDAAAKGTAKIVRSAWIETKSGQQCTTQSVLEYRRADLAGSTPTTATNETKKSGDGDAAKGAPVATASVTNNAAGHPYMVSSITHPAGLRFELEPTLGADGWTLDLNLALDYDYAPPVQRVIDEPLPEHTIRLAAPATEFHRQKFKSSITTRSGSTRMISVWKPSGTPELDGDVLQAAFLRADVVSVAPDAR
ncbi:MAG: hypothetical protein K1X78_08950 [Verrucomicrobiaceae bacterium]|nr:hypothetical protein [Verrucomicrobiaceae bacterium]